MAIDEQLPPACAFAVSVLVERDMDPDSVPEEAVEAAQQHLVTCVRCLSSPPAISPPRKKKKRRPVEPEQDTFLQPYSPAPFEEAAPLPETPFPISTAAPVRRSASLPTTPLPARTAAPATAPQPKETAPPAHTAAPSPAPSRLPAINSGPMNCARCRQVMPEYAEAMDRGENVALLYPQVQEHL